ncbi:hypothetical protein FIBSPDRAFT_946818 [Athelia psychrophila]|uniref:Uncharacterized protein n=1 Tax=Athelia psychrophila TaxID=1759441 RepID=A0A166SKS8_9AGAM|nr:hypothetical protein FIBSPDRAFT_946818 [Fibularhizoctonia sp. CBS 109695]
MTKARSAPKKKNRDVEPAATKYRGAKCHFVGEQWDFLATKSPQFLLAQDSRAQEPFYKMMGHNFVNKWGLPKFAAGEDEDNDEDEETPPLKMLGSPPMITSTPHSGNEMRSTSKRKLRRF